MSQLFRLVGKNFSKADNEWQWTYLRLSPFSFNKEIIKYITITDHYKLEHKRVITNKLILEILTGLPLEWEQEKNITVETFMFGNILLLIRKKNID